VVPYTLTNNDMKYGTNSFGTGEDFFTYCRDAFDFMYAEGESQPKMMSIGMHMRLLGHPGRASGLARLLDHMQSRSDVWICRRLEIARHWLAQHPPAA
jgi:allantoinase